MKNVIAHLNYAQLRISRKISSHVKVAHALLCLAQSARLRHKKAYSDSDINTAVKQHFIMEGLQNPPDLNWAKIFKAPVARLSIRNQWSREHEEDIIASVFQDILMGENIDTGGEWAMGSLANQIRSMREDHKDETDMRKLLKKQVHEQAVKKHRKRQRFVTYAPEDAAQGTFDPTLRRDENSAGGGNQIMLDILDMNPVSRGQADYWMTITRQNKTMRDVLRKIDKIIERKASWKGKLVWKALKNSPDFDSRRELGEDEVTFKDPETGSIRTAPLYIALGKSKPNDIWYEMEKLSKLLKRIKPAVMDMIADSEADERRA